MADCWIFANHTHQSGQHALSMLSRALSGWMFCSPHCSFFVKVSSYCGECDGSQMQSLYSSASPDIKSSECFVLCCRPSFLHITVEFLCQTWPAGIAKECADTAMRGCAQSCHVLQALVAAQPFLKANFQSLVIKNSANPPKTCSNKACCMC